MADKLPWGLKNEGISPGTVKNIPESKLKAFNIGIMNSKKGLSKKEQEEVKKRELEETAAVYQDFITSFEDSSKSINRAWVKGGVVNPEEKASKEQKNASRIYRPSTKMAELALEFKANQETKETETEKEERREKLSLAAKRREKKKSNLELFKEELKVIQEERQERRKIKQQMGVAEDPTRKTRFEPQPELVATGVSMGLSSKLSVDDPYGKGAYNYDADFQTTNLYLGNLNPKMTEMQLCEVFGKYGPLASVKIMWPRSDDEKKRGRNCGFVAFMNRKDGERALAVLQGKEVMSFEMKLGWGKAVPIPPHPVYIPPALAEMTLPPPPSGLPFNAQPRPGRRSLAVDKAYGSVPPPGGPRDGDPSEGKNLEESDKALTTAVVKVVIPTERSLLSLIHRVIEFVVREGPMFEAMIMNREISNSMFRFLFENQSPAHVYYRWKLYSILQGDSPYKWRTDEFRMFKGGSLWRPPPINPYTQGMPEELVDGTGGVSEFDVDQTKKGQLTDSQRDRFEDILRDMTPERNKIGEAMVWCLDHADAAEEIVECVAESLSILQTPIHKKIARLFLISDILHNCSAKVANASYFRKYFECKLPEIFKDVHEAYENIDARLKAEQFKQRVMGCFRVWEDWAVYPNELLINLQNVFLGLVPLKKEVEEPHAEEPDELDGAPIDDVDGLPIDDLDGAPLDGAALRAAPPGVESVELAPGVAGGRRESDELDGRQLVDSDVDGEPLAAESHERPGDPDDEVDGEPIKEDTTEVRYAPSKWESVDESLLEQQAVTTSKWELLDAGEGSREPSPSANGDDDLDGQPLDDDSLSGDVGRSQDASPGELSREGTPASGDPRLDDSQSRQEMTEERRAKLREIELKVLKYQDEVESGKRSRKPEISLTEQLAHYRRKLLLKEEDKEREKERERRREEERERVREWERARDRERERSGRDRDRGKDRERVERVVERVERVVERVERDRDIERVDRVDRVDRDATYWDAEREPPERELYREREVYRERDLYRERELERRGRDGERSERGSERLERDPSEEVYAEQSSYKLLQQYGSRSPSYSPPRAALGPPALTPPAAYREDEDSPRSVKRRPRSKSPRRRNRSRTPKKSSRSGSPRRPKRSRSRSRSPSRHRHKHKKSKRLT